MVELSIQGKQFFYFNDVEELRAAQSYLLGVDGGYLDKDIYLKAIDALPAGKEVNVWEDVI